MPGVETSSSVLDASIAVKWVIEEPESEAATALLRRPVAWIAPRLLLVEAASALRRKVANGDVRASTATAGLSALLAAVEQGTIRLVEDERLVADALSLAIESGHKVPDCMYLALAEREGCALTTGDARLAQLARSRGTAVIGIGAAGVSP